MYGFLFISLGAALTVFADYQAKRWSLSPSPWLLTTIIVLYAASGLAFTYALRFGKLTVLNAIWTIAVFTITSALGLLFFHERLSRIQFLALILGFVSIILFTVHECGPRDKTCISVDLSVKSIKQIISRR